MQVLPALEGGGVEMVTEEVSRGLVARGHRSLVVSAGGRLVEPLHKEGGEHFTLDIGKKSPLTLCKAFALRRLIMKEGVDLVNVRSRMPAWVTLLAWKLVPPSQRPRLLTTVHGLNSVNAYSRVMTYGEQVIAVSECCRDYVLENYPKTDAAKVIVIPGGVDSSQFPYRFHPSQTWTEQWLADYPQLSDRFVVLLAGRITRLKGHEQFLQLTRKLKDDGLPVHGLIVGGEDPRKKAYGHYLREQVKQLGLSNHITFTGQRSDIRDIMASCDAIVSMNTDRPESFGRTMIEAIKLGRPALGYAHGGVGEVLSKVYPEGCVAPHDLAGMASKLTDLHRGKLQLPHPTDAYELSTVIDQEVALYETMTD